MPPRYAYWTILIDQKPTAFRARERDELLPTFNQLRRTSSDVVMKWFARGRVWESPEAERAAREIPSVRAVRVGRRVTHGAQYEKTSPDAADFLIVLDFDDLAGLQAYLRHPAHEAVGDQFSRLLDSGWAYDFETGDLARLRDLAKMSPETR